MNKLLTVILMVFAWASVQADELKVADDFESGDLVSADTFNQIFDTLEKINRTVVDTDLVGVWNCSAIHASTRDWNGWTNKGLLYQVEGVQVNFTASSAATSLDSPYSFSTSSPTPFWRNSDPAAADSGTYQLFNNILIMKSPISGVNLVDWQVDIVSNSRFTLYKNIQNANQANFIVCDSAAAVPAAPISPTVTNGRTSLNLAWTDASSDETGFKIYRKLSSESEAELVATQTAVTYSDTDLTEGQTAYYHVTAYNDNGESGKSKAVSATLDNTAPRVVAVTPSTSEKILRPTASWSDSGDEYRTTFTFQFSEPVRAICEENPLVTMAIECPGNKKNDTVKAELIDSQTGSVTSSSDFFGLTNQPYLYTLRSSWAVGPLNWDAGTGNNDRNWALVGDKLRLTWRGVRMQDENGIFMDDTLSWTYDLKTE